MPTWSSALTWIAGSGVIGYVLSRPSLAGTVRPPGWQAGRERLVVIVLSVTAPLAFVLAVNSLQDDPSKATGWISLAAATFFGGAAIGTFLLRRRRIANPPTSDPG